MGTIEQIIQAIDDDLIDRDKEYLLLGQAHKLLIDQDLLLTEEKIDETFKKFLEDNKIPHAYQTNSAPKQWRIPLSNEGVKRKNKLGKVVSSQSKQKYSQTSFPKNPNDKIPKNFLSGIGVILLFVVFWIYSSDDKEMSPTSTLQYINTDTYVATSKSNFDEMFNYIGAYLN